MIPDDYREWATCRLTTVGRRTGNPHTISIWFAYHNGTIYLMAGGRDGSDWVRNLRANPEVTISFSVDRYQGRGRVVEGADEDRLARDLVHDKYADSYGGSLTRWREESLPVAVDLAPPG